MASLGLSLTGFVVLYFLYICYKQWRYSNYLSDLPWIGCNDRVILSRLRARIHNLKNFETGIKTAYEQYSVKGQSFVFPTLETDLVILPPSHIEWLNNQPEDLISQKQPVVDQIQGDLTFPHWRVLHISLHHQVIHRDLTRHLGNHIKDIMDEIDSAIHDLWPQSFTEFQNVHVFPIAMEILTRTSNRIFVGLPYCREKEYLTNLMDYAKGVSLWSAILKQLPERLRPLVSKVCLRRTRQNIRNIVNILTPEIEKRRIAMADTEKANNLNYNDALQALIIIAEEHGGPELDPAMIVGRLIALNFAAIHTSTFSFTNIIFDIISSNPADRVIEQLREEAEATFREGDGVWTKASLAKMYKLDSTLRESQRINSFLGAGMTRQVIAKEGLTTPNGTHLPYMTKFAFPSYGVHNDNNTYPESGRYDPFRWAKQRTASSDDDSEDDSANSYIRKANLAFVSTSMNYHPFGHGRHSCPGRFFAAIEMKLLLAHLVLNYDFELLEQRPKSKWYGPVLVPPMDSSIRVRRRRRQHSSRTKMNGSV